VAASKRDNAAKSPQAGAAGFLLLAAAALAIPLGAARGVVSFDFEAPVFYEPGEIVKDHSLILIDGTFHLYYMATDTRSFGYATSLDLRHWDLHGQVLQAGPDQWDGTRIWAPNVVPYPFEPLYYLMYYTGVNNAFAQRTCLALTHVPYLWSKASQALFVPFHGDTAWIEWNDDEWSNYRDPCFFHEDRVSYLVQSVLTRTGLGAIAFARSNDYFNWEDAGPLYIHDSWHAIESPFLLKRDGLYHLFFTEEAVGGVSHMASSSLASGWDIAHRSIIDGGHAAEVLDAGADRYIMSRHTSYSSAAGLVSSLRFDTLGWSGDVPEVEMTGLLGGWTVLWGEAFDHQPVMGDNPLFRGGDAASVGFEGNWWIGTYEAFSGPLTGTLPGAFQGDAARGALRSGDFEITGRSMRLLVGGGRFPDSCYVALCDARTGEILRRETGMNTDRMDERIWDLYPFRGLAAYLVIVDDCAAPFGHINVDGIEERMTAVGPPPDDDTRRAPDKRDRIVAFERRASAGRGEAASGAASLTGYPNPFNPCIDLRIVTKPVARVAVSLYDVGGHAVSSFPATTDERGKATIRWNGRDARGAMCPSGIYFAVLREGSRTLATAKLVLER